jgi:Tfp pilus assembly protein PilF
MRGQPAKALFYIKRALQLAPDNYFAQHDLAYAMQKIEEQQRASAGK